MKLDLIPFGPIMPPPDLLLALRHPQYFSAADRCTHQMAIGLAEVSIPQTKTTVSLGEYQFEDVPTGLHETAIFAGEAGLLGNGLLSRFSSVTIDAKAGRVVLEMRSPAQ